MAKILKTMNLVMIQLTPGKNDIHYQNLINLFNDSEIPTTVWPQDLLSPGLILYQNNGLVISVAMNNFTIQFDKLPTPLNNYAKDLMLKIIKERGNIPLTSYGFNFTYDYDDRVSVKNLFRIDINPVNYSYKPDTIVKFSFTKDAKQYNIDFTDKDPSFSVHVNVHHPEATDIANLLQNFDNLYNEDFKDAIDLIEEMVIIGNTD